MTHLFFRCLLLILIIVFSSCRPRREVWTPSASPEFEQQQADQKRRENVRKNDKPLTERQIRRNMRKRDKRQRKEFRTHHERIQRKEVQKRMKQNNRTAQAHNHRKKPNIIRKLIIRFSE